jgi:hypothetical protein
MAQRWLVVYAQAADERAAATLHHARQRKDEAIRTPRLHLPAKRCATPEAAHETRTAVATGWTDHQLDACHLSGPKRSARTGRPPPSTPVTAIDWPIQAHVRPHEAAIGPHQQRHACCVIGTPIGASAWTDTEGIAASKRQSRVEGGCRFRKDPRFLSRRCWSKSPVVSKGDGW